MRPAPLFIAMTLLLSCRSVSSSAVADERPPPPSAKRYAWDGFTCTANLPWSGEQGTFATRSECERAFVTRCASTPTPRVDQIAEPVHAKLDAELEAALVHMRSAPDAQRDDGFFRIAFVTTAPLSIAQHETLSCWGVVLGSSVGTVHFGALSKKALPVLASLAYVERIEMQREPQLNARAHSE